MNPPTQTAEGHTPTPWTLKSNGHNRLDIWSATTQIGEIYSGGSNPNNAGHANAQLCIEAVNSHAALTARVAELEHGKRMADALMLEGSQKLDERLARVAKLEAALTSVLALMDEGEPREVPIDDRRPDDQVAREESFWRRHNAATAQARDALAK